ncbi:MAG: homoserine O-acetyltransferase MetX [Ilumatobacteraceae bacterium]|jgi:homoserine O-acetyltransferase|nr:homoserine O-acetyltransferase [Acidimicrobiia bacterium]
MSSELHPVTGAWCPGDPAGNRQFLALDRKLALDGGGVLDAVEIAYETWGTLNDDASNAVLLCHAWTGDSHAAGRAGPGHPTPGWWESIVGPRAAIDTDRWFVVCSNVLGGCQGTTGPSSLDPQTGVAYGSKFPVVTIRDMVRAQARLADHLGIRRWHSVIGGSMGGMQVLEWAVTYPDRVRSIVPIASCLQASAQQIAWESIGRRAILHDPNFRGGDYYDAPAGQGPHRGLSTARMVAQVTFRSDNVFNQKFGRDVVGSDQHSNAPAEQQFEVERYLEYHGDKLTRRFDANSYLLIGRAMDLHDIARGRGGLDSAIKRITAPTLSIGIASDMLYPSYQQIQIRDALVAHEVRADYVEIDSPHGHDSFLIDLDQVAPPITRFLESVG